MRMEGLETCIFLLTVVLLSRYSRICKQIQSVRR